MYVAERGVAVVAGVDLLGERERVEWAAETVMVGEGWVYVAQRRGAEAPHADLLGEKGRVPWVTENGVCCFEAGQ